MRIPEDNSLLEANHTCYIIYDSGIEDRTEGKT